MLQFCNFEENCETKLVRDLLQPVQARVIWKWKCG